jgi:hyperosmotically inducible periplasmic protein
MASSAEEEHLTMKSIHWTGYLGTAALVAAIPFSCAMALAQGGDDGRIQADAHKALDSKRFANVTVEAHGGNVVLGGSVADYADKEAADNRMHHVHGVHGVDNEIQVGGARVEDAALREKLSKELATYRVGYGTNAFNNINLGVQNGVVTLSGTVYGPTDKSDALSVVSSTPGVRDVIDNLDVAPLSPMDDQLRIRLARAIYGAPELQRYAMDPQNPIRITVVNGNVTLNGVVDSKMDRDIAGIKANGVSGVFKVTNNLQVAGPSNGK